MKAAEGRGLARSATTDIAPFPRRTRPPATRDGGTRAPGRSYRCRLSSEWALLHAAAYGGCFRSCLVWLAYECVHERNDEEGRRVVRVPRPFPVSRQTKGTGLSPIHEVRRN